MTTTTTTGPREPGEQTRALDADHADDAKLFARLQASAALHGLVLHRLQGEDGATAYLIARNTLSKEVGGLDAVADFLNRWKGKR
jgi:hypothetical protein